MTDCYWCIFFGKYLTLVTLYNTQYITVKLNGQLLKADKKSNN